MCLPASQKAEKPSWQFVQMCLLNLDTSQIFSVLCFLQSFSSSYIRFKCHQWPVCTVTEDGVPSALCGWWLSQHSVCELVPDAVRTTQTPRVHLTYVCVGDSNGRVRSVLGLDAAVRHISSFSGIVCVSSLCERYDAAHVCMWNIMSWAVVESHSIFISTHTDMLTVCTTLFLYFTACQRKYIWGKCCLLFKFRWWKIFSFKTFIYSLNITHVVFVQLVVTFHFVSYVLSILLK